MNIKKAMKVLKAAERLKKYCGKRELCKGCIFYDESLTYTETCMLRRDNPEEYDLDKISRGLTIE